MTLDEFLAYRTKTGRLPEVTDFRKLYRVSEVKIGSGEKQTSVFYVHEKTDPKGDYFQATTLGRTAADEQVERCAADRRKELIQLAFQASAITWYDVRTALREPAKGCFMMSEPPVDPRANLTSSATNPDPFVRVSARLCQRSGHNRQWLIDDALRGLTLDELGLFGLLSVHSEAEGPVEGDPYVRLADALCKRMKKSMSEQEAEQLAKQLEKRGAKPLIPKAHAMVEQALRAMTAEDAAELSEPLIAGQEAVVVGEAA